MLHKWEQFELDAVKYLKENFGSYAFFERKGGSDSTEPDIRVTGKNGEISYVEVKLSPAQSGQFVLLPDLSSQSFIYSEKNATPLNQFSEAIRTYMNSEFEEFKEAGTKGREIQFQGGSKIFGDWISQAYAEKGVKWFISNNFTIIPLDRFNEFFDVRATYRVKRSGSSRVGKAYIPKVREFLTDAGHSPSSIREDEGRLFLNSPDNPPHSQRFLLGNNEFMFSKRDDELEVRKLSNTFNANVIFSIELEEASPEGMTDKEFIESLE